MSTPNFQTQRNFKLFLWDYNRPTDEEIDKILIEDNGFEKEEITDSIRQNYCDAQYDSEVNDIVSEFSYMLKEITRKRPLQFFNIVLKDGYYCGVQFFVEHDTSCSWFTDLLNSYSLEDITNEDTKEYGMCHSEFIRKYKSEINYINKKVMPKLAKYFGFEEYTCVGIFSNGEAIYSKVTNSKREKLLKAVA